MTRAEAVAAILGIIDAAQPPMAPDGAAPAVTAGKNPPRSQMGAAAPTKPAGETTTVGRQGGRGGAPPGSGGEDPHKLNLRLAFLPQTDLGNAERFRERNRDRLLYCPTLPGAGRAGGWLWWDATRWSLTGADEKVRRAEHDCVRAIQLEAKACEAEAARLLERYEGAADVAARHSAKDAKKKGKGKKGKKGPRLATVDGIPVDMPAEAKKAAKADIAKIGLRAYQLGRLADKLRGWGRASEANSKMVPIARHAAAYLAIEQGALDRDRFAFNVMNGTLLFRRVWDAAEPAIAGHARWRAHGSYVKFKPHDPADLITRLAPVVFDRDAACPQFLRFLGEIQPEAAMRAFLQDWKGYSMTGDTGEARLCLFLGRGRNGKGVLETATGYVFGDYAGSTPIETFTLEARSRSAGQATPELAKLPGIRALRTSEPAKGAKLDEALIKLVTGEDPLDARHLNRPFFTFFPQFKLTVSGNHEPRVSGNDEGIWSRVTLVPFGVFVPPERRDTKLADKLRGEASGILNWMLDGLSAWMEHGLRLPETVQAATAEYRRNSDQLGRFLELCTLADPPGTAEPSRTQSSLLLEVHNAWAVAGGGSEWRQKGFTDAMRERGFKSTKSSVMFFLGIRLTKGVGDFLDSGGRPKRGAADADASPVTDDDEFR